ncbi:MAG: rhombosortase [Phycisphaerales bacterium]
MRTANLIVIRHSAAPAGWSGGAALLLTLIAVIVMCVPGANQTLQFSRTGIEAGQWWRIITGHWTHFSFEHLLWDGVMFASMGWVVCRYSMKRFGICVAASAAAISLAVYVMQPGFEVYRGLSGIDTALFTAACVLVGRAAWAKRDRATMSVVGIALAGLMAKVIYEVIVGRPVFVQHDKSFTVVPLAHMVGAVIGVLTGFVGRMGHEGAKTRRVSTCE